MSEKAGLNLSYNFPRTQISHAKTIGKVNVNITDSEVFVIMKNTLHAT